MRALLREGVACEAICRRALRACELLRRTPLAREVDDLPSGIAYLALKTRASGIALGSRVYIRREYFARDGHVPIGLLAHEVTHVAQFHRDGVARFLWRYLRAYLVGLSRGLGDHNAYLSIPYEVEARRVARLVEDTCESEPGM